MFCVTKFQHEHVSPATVNAATNSGYDHNGLPLHSRYMDIYCRTQPTNDAQPRQLLVMVSCRIATHNGTAMLFECSVAQVIDKWLLELGSHVNEYCWGGNHQQP
jgi:hypothetical protein